MSKQSGILLISFAFLFVFFQYGIQETHAAISYVGSASTPADNGSQAGPGPVAVTPPAMQAGDFVLIIGAYRGTGVTISISQAGGQTWTSLAAATRGTVLTTRLFYCIFNGTWSANPSISIGSGTAALSAIMHVFRGVDPTTPLDVSQTVGNFAAPASPYDVTITGVTTNTDGAWVFAVWASTSTTAATWSLQTGGWANVGGAQYRNTSGTDISLSAAYKAVSPAGPSGNVTNRESQSAAGTTHILALKEASTLTLADHASGQVGDKFTTTSWLTDVLFRFKLTRLGTLTVDNLRVNFTTTGGVADGDVTNGELWVDNNSDGAVDGGDTQIQGGVTASGGIITFTTDFTPGTGGTNYLVRATVSNLASGDTTTFSFGTADIDVIGATKSGSITNATHTQDLSQLTKRWGENSNCDYTSVTQDTYLDSGQTTYEEGGCNGAYAVRVGYRTDAGTRAFRGLIKFNFSNIPITDSSQIVSAYLKVNVDFVSSGSTINFDAYRVLKSWSGGDTCHDLAESGETTWQYQIYSTTQWSTAGCNGSGSDRTSASAGTFSVSTTGWKSWDVTQSARDMYASGNYYGWVLKSQSESGINWFSFYSSEDTTASNRPYLEITYVPGTGGQFEYRREIIIDYTKLGSSCTGDLSNFPVLVNLSENWLKTTGNGGRIYNSNGYDIVFRDSDGRTPFKHEIEKYNGLTGDLVAWVKVPTISYTANTTFYMYYGNSAITSPTADPTNVWDSNFLAVWHLKEDPSGSAPQIKNSKSASYNGTSYGSMTSGDQVAGKMDGSLDMDGTDDRIQVGPIVGNRTAYTVSLWFKTTSATFPMKIWGEGNTGDNGPLNYIAIESAPGDIEFCVRDDGWSAGCPAYSAGLNDGNWHYVVGVQRAKNDRELYVDGISRGTDTTTLGTVTVDTGNIGAINRMSIEMFYSGVVDEVRISNIARDACWIETSFSNKNTPSAFYSVKSEQNPAPTAVSLTSFTAVEYEEGVLLKWQTGYEVDNLGFHVYREENGQLYRLTPELVAGSALLAGSGTFLTGRNYSWFDSLSDNQFSTTRSQPSVVRYWLEDVDINGKHTRYGPVNPFRSHEPLPAKFKPGLLSEVGMRLQEQYGEYWKIQEFKETLKERLRPKNSIHYKISVKPNNDSRITYNERDLSSRPEADLDSTLSPQSSSLDPVMQPVLAGKPAVKLLVRKEGWYRVGQPELVTAGLDPNVNPRNLHLYAEGREQPIRVIGERDGRFDPGDAIEFYGSGLDTLSTDTKVYWLIDGSLPGRRIQERPGWTIGASGSSFSYTVEKKDRLLYFAALKNGEESNFFGPVVSATPSDQILDVPYPDIGSSWEAILEVHLQGVTTVKHWVKVLLNGSEVGDLKFDGRTRGFVKLSVPQSLILDGKNLLTLVAQGEEVDISLVDTIRFTYWRTYQVDEDTLTFQYQAGKKLTLSGFSQPGIRVVDITNPEMILEAMGTVRAEGPGYSITFKTPGLGRRKLLAFTDDKVKGVARIVANEPSSWHSSRKGYDFVIVSHKDFLPSLEPLKRLRESQGLRVALVDVEDLYDEFYFGVKNPQAIKDFVELARKQWVKKPRFVLLVGDATFDPRNYMGFGDNDLVPTKLVDTRYLETASDDWFVDFNDDGLPDMAIGRLPVRTGDEANTVISKIIAYEQGLGGAMREVLLVADMEDEEYSYEAASARLMPFLPQGITVWGVARGRYGSDEEVREDLIRSINLGPLLVNYMGHGSGEIWRGGVFSTDDAGSLTNGNRLPFFINMTCLNGFFQDVFAETLAESLLKAGQGGAVAVWASSGLTTPDYQGALNKELYRLLFNGEGLTIGEAVMRAKAATPDQDVRKTWILFGDPSMRLRP